MVDKERQIFQKYEKNVEQVLQKTVGMIFPRLII